MTDDEKIEYLRLIIDSIERNLKGMEKWEPVPKPSLCVGCPELDVGNISFLLLEQERYLQQVQYRGQHHQ